MKKVDTATVATVGMRKRCSGTIGCSARCSIRRKSTSPTAESANNPITWRLVQPQEPARLSAIMAGNTVMVRPTRPAISKRCGFGGGRSQGILNNTTASARGPTKSMIQNTQRHDSASVSTPPNGAPIRLASANTPPNRPMNFPRSTGG